MRTLHLGDLTGRGTLYAPAVSSPTHPLFCYISLLDSLIWNTFFVVLFRMSSHSIFMYIKLGVQTNYPSAWMFLFRTLATTFPTFYRMKTACSFWVWKLSNDACPLNLVPTASFLTRITGEESQLISNA